MSLNISRLCFFLPLEYKVIHFIRDAIFKRILKNLEIYSQCRCMCGNVYLVFMCSCCGATSAFFHCLTLFVLSYFHLCISLAPPFISAPLSFAHRKPASERDSCRAVRARGKTASNLDCYQFSKKAPTLRKNSSCRCEL